MKFELCFQVSSLAQVLMDCIMIRKYLFFFRERVRKKNTDLFKYRARFDIFLKRPVAIFFPFPPFLTFGG
jgi:hypothetical protein